jgi:hypothetical protein
MVLVPVTSDQIIERQTDRPSQQVSHPVCEDAQYIKHYSDNRTNRIMKS